MDGRPIGIFDSGAGGLTVLHECLVTMPHEDFVYLGDGARCPYGPRPVDEIRRFALEIASYLERCDVKLIVDACNTATAAALPLLQEQLSVPVVGVLAPEAHAAVQATRNRKIGVLATAATVDSGRYAATIRALDAGTSVVSVACPKLVPMIEAGAVDGGLHAAVRDYAAPLQDAGVDTVILGCTHYPLIRPVFERVFGRGTALVFSADETAREVAETLARRDVENDRSRIGTCRFTDDGLAGGVPRARRALPAASGRNRRADRDQRARARSGMTREGRRPDELRPVSIDTGFLEQADGSALISFGRTRVLCAASIEDSVPRWLAGSGRGWLTAEYGMLPASTGQRIRREASEGKQKGRTVEIQRLIGRSLRAAYDMETLGERTVWLDCDVIEADGGTRTAAISGAWVALARAAAKHGLPAPADVVSAVSVGIVDGEALLDLDYGEDSTAEVDMNVVMTGDGRLIEVQATAERVPFERAQLDELLGLAAQGIDEIAVVQREAAA